MAYDKGEVQVTGEPEKVTVRWYNEEKGYGFVADEQGNDLFIHVSALRRAGLDTLTEGQELTIQRGPGKKAGQQSANLIVVE